MRRLHDSLTRPNGAQTAITSRALYGLGGIGKTRAAIEYAWAQQDDYTALLFVIAETPEALRRNLAALAGLLALPEREAAEDEARLAAVLDWLRPIPAGCSSWITSTRRRRWTRRSKRSAASPAGTW